MQCIHELHVSNYMFKPHCTAVPVSAGEKKQTELHLQVSVMEVRGSQLAEQQLACLSCLA